MEQGKDDDLVTLSLARSLVQNRGFWLRTQVWQSNCTKMML